MAGRSVRPALCALVFLLTCSQWGNGLLDSLPEVALHTLLYKVSAWSQLSAWSTRNEQCLLPSAFLTDTVIFFVQEPNEMLSHLSKVCVV